MTVPKMLKYPRTRHIEGSCQQLGDEDLQTVPFSEIRNLPLAVEEKVDGANCGISFDSGGNLLLQSRGHYLTGGLREKHFALFKQWGTVQQNLFWEVLRDRYIMYGEWLYAKHTIFYDKLPHFFMEFDVFDRKNGIFLDTPSRRDLLGSLPIVSVPLLKTGPFQKLEDLTSLIGPSRFISENHIETLHRFCRENSISPDETDRHTDPSLLMEGIYIKHEENGQVAARYKFVRGHFRQTSLESDSNWLARPIVPNCLTIPLDGLFLNRLPASSKNRRND